MATRLGDGIISVGGAVTRLPGAGQRGVRVASGAVVESLQAEWPFYVWDQDTGVVRLMCSFDTTESDVDAFVARLGALMRGR